MSQQHCIIEIREGDTVRVHSGVSRRNNRPYQITKQEGWYHDKKAPYPTRIEVALEDGQVPYAPGFYTVDFQHSVYVDRFDSLQLGRLLLMRQTPKAVEKTA